MTKSTIARLAACAALLATLAVCGCNDQLDPDRVGNKQFDTETARTKTFVGKTSDDVVAAYGEPTQKMAAPEGDPETLYLYDTKEHLASKFGEYTIVRRAFWVNSDGRVTKVSIAQADPEAP